MEKVRNRLNKEMDIMTMLRTLRYLRKGMHLLLTDTKRRKELKKACLYEVIDLTSTQQENVSALAKSSSKVQHFVCHDTIETIAADKSSESLNVSETRFKQSAKEAYDIRQRKMIMT